MKWFVFAIIIAAAYLTTMLGATNVLLGQTEQLQRTYAHAQEQADQLARSDEAQH